MGIDAGAGMSASAGMSAVFSSLSSNSESIEAETEEVSDFVGWTRLSDIFLTGLCSTKFLSSL